MISYLIIFFSLLIILFPKKKDIKADTFYSLIFCSLSYSQVILGFISLVLILFGVSRFPTLIISCLLFLFTFARNKNSIKYLKRTKTFLLNEVIQIIKKQENSKYQKILFCLCILLLVAISISSIGPINHPDAADYHVGYPSQYFSKGRFFIDGGLHQGLLGIGDYANLAFIQENSIWLIRFLQIINLPLLFIFLAKKFKNNIYLLTFLSVPTIIQWSTIGKPLFLGESSLIAIYLIWRQNKDSFSLKLLLISIVSCLSVKISSSLVITPIFFDLGIYYYQNYKLKKELLKTIKDSVCSREFIFINLILLTLLYSRYIITGNFAYPLLTNIFNKGDDLVINFSNFLKNYQRQELFIIKLFIPTKLSNIGETLGLSTLLIILGIIVNTIKNNKLIKNNLFYVSISQLFLLFLFGQGRSDYYIGPLILIIYQYENFKLLILKSKLKYIFYLTTIFQFMLINIYLSISIFYNFQAFFDYENFMKKTAYGYANSTLIDMSLPGKTFINDRNTRLYYSFDYFEKDKLKKCIKNKTLEFGEKAEEMCFKENDITQILSSKESEKFKNLYECKNINSFKTSRNFLKRKPSIINYCKIKN